MKAIKKIFKNQTGAGLVVALVGASAIGAGIFFMLQSTGLRNTLLLDMSQNSLVENTMLDIKTTLASAEQCKESMDFSGGPFQKIGNYAPNANKDIGLHVYISSIELVESLNNDREQEYRVRFIKKNPSKKTQKEKTDTFFIQKFQNENTTLCSSFETVGVDNSMKSFCLSLGGTFDESQGRCLTDTINDGDFANTLGKEACLALGGSFDLGSKKCNGINIPTGTLASSHLKNNNLSISSGSKNNFSGSMCTGIQVAAGFNANGGVNCKTVTCPKPDTSSYRAIASGDDIVCQCQRDRGSDLACGQADINSCTSYSVDDGCGTGNTCTIRRGKDPDCPTNIACGRTITIECNKRCSGPPCPDPPPSGP